MCRGEFIYDYFVVYPAHECEIYKYKSESVRRIEYYELKGFINMYMFGLVFILYVYIDMYFIWGVIDNR